MKKARSHARIVQLKTTAAGTIAFDFRRRDARVDEMFNATAARNGRQWIANNPRGDFTQEVTNNRANYADFKNKGGTTMSPDIAGVRGLASASLGRQQMFVIQGGNLTYRRDQSSDDNPMAHPMLLGGDPDVTFAGTITTRNVQNALQIVVNNDSGHFQFDGAETKGVRPNIINAVTANLPFNRRKTTTGKDIQIRVRDARGGSAIGVG